MAKLRVLVADDSQFQRVAYTRILETQDHLEVVGMAADGEEAVRLAEQLNPDVVVMDIRMPKINGIEAAQRITSARPGTGIVVISHYDDTEYILELLKDGPEGKEYLLKTSVDNIDDLIRAVGAVAEGYNNAVIAQRLVVEERTVENHTNSIYAKFNLTQAQGYHRRVQAVLAFVTQSSPTTAR